jgi:hypothetical protein
MRRALKAPSKARLVLAVMWSVDFDLSSRVLSELEKAFGKIKSKSAVFDFTHTAYYQKEMGVNLKKCFVEIDGLVDRDSLATHKLSAMAFEEKHLERASRKVNVDPLLVTSENVVIATSKNFPHRVYLRDGVYADLALTRRKGAFEALPWTYGDYSEHVGFFETIYNQL